MTAKASTGDGSRMPAHAPPPLPAPPRGPRYRSPRRHRRPPPTAAGSEKAQALAGRTLEGLARLRPENLVVLLQRGSRAIATGDRATATASYLRVREVLWQPPPAAGPALSDVLAALEKNDLAAARVPALRLENVLKATSMYQGSQHELTRGIQGVPVTRFRDEPPPADWGPPTAGTPRPTRLDAPPGPPEAALTAADFDGD